MSREVQVQFCEGLRVKLPRATHLKTWDRLWGRLKMLSNYLMLLGAWWRIGESNPWPLECKSSALPTELIPHSIQRAHMVHFFFCPRNMKITFSVQ